MSLFLQGPKHIETIYIQLSDTIGNHYSEAPSCEQQTEMSAEPKRTD